MYGKAFAFGGVDNSQNKQNSWINILKARMNIISLNISAFSRRLAFELNL